MKNDNGSATMSKKDNSQDLSIDSTPLHPSVVAYLEQERLAREDEQAFWRKRAEEREAQKAASKEEMTLEEIEELAQATKELGDAFERAAKNPPRYIISGGIIPRPSADEKSLK